VVKDASQDGDMDLTRACLPQNRRCLRTRCSGRQDIVHQQHACTSDNVPINNAKRPRLICKSPADGNTLLRSSNSSAAEYMVVARDAQTSSQLFCDQRSWIASPHESLSPVVRHRNDQITCEVMEIRSPLTSQHSGQ